MVTNFKKYNILIYDAIEIVNSFEFKNILRRNPVYFTNYPPLIYSIEKI